MPQLSHRHSGTRHGKITDDTQLVNPSKFCNTIGGKADTARLFYRYATTEFLFDLNQIQSSRTQTIVNGPVRW
ncbi:MAG: hypothetical protein WBG18_03390, partial [Xanthobacteraceae bacterium]